MATKRQLRFRWYVYDFLRRYTSWSDKVHDVVEMWSPENGDRWFEEMGLPRINGERVMNLMDRIDSEEQCP